MNDQSPSTRQSVGLVELRGEDDLHSTAPADKEEALVDRPSSEEDLLQFFLAAESSRQEMETYTRYLDTVVRETSEARREAEAAARLKSEFLATISHEMRTPLNGIIGMTSVLLSRELGELERDYIATIRHASETLRGIVDDVLDLAKIDAGKLRLERTEFHLAGAVSDTLDMVKSLAAQKSLKLVVNHDPRLPVWVRGDAGRIQQILLNLINNAIKFTDHGTIEIKTRAQFIDHEECELLVSVKDEGIGINDELQHKLFQPFTQAEDSTAHKYGGTGLGLAICKRLAELMGGQIGVTSRFGAGSLFWFTVRLHVCQEPPAPGEPVTVTPEETPQVARILLVEDNKINQKVARLMLNNLGYEVDTVQSGAQALLAFDCSHYDLVLMNCLMPEMDGFETTRRLRQFDGHGGLVPIIAMTANAFDDNRVACLTAGMNDFISKPVKEADLAAKLKFWLSSQKLNPPSGD